MSTDMRDYQCIIYDLKPIRMNFGVLTCDSCEGIKLFFYNLLVGISCLIASF